MQNRSYISNSNSHDNTFNFGNQLDISNTKKNKNSELNQKDMFQFDDFQNIGDDKTIKSSFYKTKKDNFSNIIKKQYDQLSKGTILQNQQDLGFNSNPYVSASMRKIYYEEQKYPKFGQRKHSGMQVLEINNYYENTQSKQNFRQSQLAYTKSNFGIDPQLYKDQYRNNNNNELGVDSRVNSNIHNNNIKNPVYFNKKPQPYNHQYVTQIESRESQYKQLISLINFYKNQSQKLSYQRSCLQQSSIKQLVSLSNNQFMQQQVSNRIQHINSLNNQIQKQRAIQKKLTNVINQLEDQYSQIIESVKQMDFRRPVVIKDDVKVLIEEIDILKKQFEVIERQNGQLNFSCTLEPSQMVENNHKYNNNHIYNNNNNRKQQQYNNNKYNQLTPTALPTYQSLTSSRLQQFTSLFSQIYQQNSLNQDINFLKNLKLSCLKQQWTIFQNKQVQISLDYHTYSYIKINIGNKTNRLLRKFCIERGGETSGKVMVNQVLNRKCFIVEKIKIDQKDMKELFVKFKINYDIDNDEKQSKSTNNNNRQQLIHKQINLFCSTGILNFGQFIPMSSKQFQQSLYSSSPIISSSLRTIDKTIISSLEQILMYFPNLKLNQQKDKIVYGKFVSVNDEETIVIIEDHCELVKVKIKGKNVELLKVMEFVLCL